MGYWSLTAWHILHLICCFGFGAASDQHIAYISKLASVLPAWSASLFVHSYAEIDAYEGQNVDEEGSLM